MQNYVVQLQSFCNSKYFFMPTNLNALLRYKQIDACLKNRFVDCTIDKLQDNCSIALGEFRGIYKRVSKRTISDDIRVMRSDMLGFSAPIEVSDGKYYYSDENYSIFSTPLTEIELLKDILKLLLEERNNIADTEVDNLLSRISTIVGKPIPTQLESSKDKISHEVKEEDQAIMFSKTRRSTLDDIRFISRNRDEVSGQSVSKEPLKYYNEKKILLWREILAVLY